MTGMFKLRSSIRKFAAYGLILVLILGIGFTDMTAYADNAAEDQDVAFSDVEDHWAAEQILDWSGRGLVAGYANGTFGPERGVTRAEFITFVNRAYGLKEKASAAFVDVSSADWFVDEVAKAVAAEYISGYDDGTMRPNAEISRLEAAVILYRLLRLDSYKSESWIDGFNDADTIADWGRVYVNSAVAEGYFSGYPDGTFKPGRVITRAETVSLLSKAAGTLYNVSGVYGPAEHNKRVEGNVTVSVSGVTLKDLTIEGDLFLTAGIGDGDFEADGVVVKGRTIIGGGGYESIVFNNSTLGDVIVYVVDGKVRVVAKGDTSINDVILESGGFLQEDNLTGEGFGNVQILVLKPGQEVELDGDFDSVDIETSVEMNVTGNTRIKELNVSEDADGTEINLGRDTVIDTLTLDGGTDVTGKGTIKTANVNTDDYSFERDPDKTVVEGEKPEEDKKEEEEDKGKRREQPSKKSVSAISVDDVPVVGMTIKAKDLKPAGATVDYQWQRAPMGPEGEYGEFENIEGATDATYVVDKYYGCGSAPGNGFAPMMYIPEEVIRLKVTGKGNYRGTVYSDPVGPIVEGTGAVFNATGAVGIAPDTAGEAAGKLFAEYELSQMNNGNGAKISLKEGEIDYIKVQVGDENWRELEPNIDETLWFNVEAETGKRTFVVKVTENGDAIYYIATLDWEGPQALDVEKQNDDLIKCGDGVYRYHYKINLAMKKDDTLVYRIKPTGEIDKQTINDDSDDYSIYFRPTDGVFTQLEGDHTYMIKKDDVWYEGAITYQDKSKYGFTLDDEIKVVAVAELYGGHTIKVTDAGIGAGSPGDVPDEALEALVAALVGEEESPKLNYNYTIDGLNNSRLVKVTLKATKIKDTGYDKVRILPLTVKKNGENASDKLQAWMYAAVDDQKWFNTVVTGWGTQGTGFKLDPDENSKMDVYIFAKEPGDYEITFKAVDTSRGVDDTKDEAVIATGTATVTVEDFVSKLAENHYNAGDTLSFTISGFNPQEEVRVGMLIHIGGGGFPYAGDIKILDTVKEVEVERDGQIVKTYPWVGKADGSGVLSVNGIVQPNLPSGVLYITLPDHGSSINNAIELQTENGVGVRVGDSD